MTKYQLHVSGYTGNAGDSLYSHDAKMFSTYDRDNDDYAVSCAQEFRGAWWYESCHGSNLNGEYRIYGIPSPGYARGVIWSSDKPSTYSYKRVEMKIKRNV